MASLSPLADLEDIEDRLGRDLEPEESRKSAALIRDASTVVRNYCRRDFTHGTTTARFRPRGRKVSLPQRPVLTVTAVKAVLSYGTNETITPLAYWSWPGGSEVILGDPNLIINAPDWVWDDSEVWCEITYTHGFTEIPDDIRSVVANMVIRNLTAPKGGLIDTEGIGPYQVRYSGFVSQGPLGISEPDRQLLNRYRSTVAQTLELRG